MTGETFQLFEDCADIGKHRSHEIIKDEIIRYLIPSYPGYSDQYLSGTCELYIYFRWFG